MFRGCIIGTPYSSPQYSQSAQIVNALNSSTGGTLGALTDIPQKGQGIEHSIVGIALEELDGVAPSRYPSACHSSPQHTRHKGTAPQEAMGIQPLMSIIPKDVKTIPLQPDLFRCVQEGKTPLTYPFPEVAPLERLELSLPAPEAGALSSELQGRTVTY